MPSSRTSRVNTPIGLAARRANMKKAKQSTIKLNQLPPDLLRRIASHLPARRNVPPVTLQEDYRDAYTTQDNRNGIKHRFEVVRDSRHPPRGAQMVRQVIGKRPRSVPTSRAEDFLDQVVNALELDGRRRKNKYVARLVIDDMPEGSPIYLSDDPDDMDEPVSAHWVREHRIRMKQRGGTANDLLRVSQLTRDALRRPGDKRVRKTRSKPNVPKPASRRTSRR